MNPRLPRRGPRSSHPDQVARPTLVPIRRRSLKTFLLEEWSLLLLAAALSIIVWIVVGEQVIQRHEISNVVVELVVDPAVADQIDAVFSVTARTTVTLNCSQREYDEAVRSLDRRGRRVVTLHVRTVPTGNVRGLDRESDHYDWHFDHNRILVSAPIPTGQVFKVEPRVVNFATPETIPNAAQLEALGLKVEISIKPLRFPHAAPSGFLEDDIRADALNVSALVDDDNARSGRSTDMRLAFSAWRSDDSQSAAVKAWRRELKLPDVVAQVTVTQVGVDSRTNRLYFQLDPTKYEFEFNSPQDMTSNGVNLADGLSFEGRLHGPKTVLKQLADPKNAHKWAWGVVIIDPEKLSKIVREDESGSPQWTILRAVLVWLPYEDEFRNQGVTFDVPEPLSPDFDIKVRLRPESK